jgi:hypothetical protein
MTIGYQDLIKNVKTALITKDKADTTLTNMGAEVAEFFGSEKAIDEVKAQFCADAILPIIKKHHAEALAKDLPKLNSKAYNELVSKDASYSEKWEIANQAKKDARSTIATYYKRVKSYAFPAEKKDKVVKSFADKIKALIEEAGKMSEANFDLPSCVGYLNQALFVATK